MDTAAATATDSLFLRHDLMIELGRLEMAIDDAHAHAAASEANDETVRQLESRRAKVNEALIRPPA